MRSPGIERGRGGLPLSRLLVRKPALRCGQALILGERPPAKLHRAAGQQREIVLRRQIILHRVRMQRTAAAWILTPTARTRNASTETCCDEGLQQEQRQK